MTDKQTITALAVTTVILAIGGTYLGVNYFTTLSDMKLIAPQVTDWKTIPKARQDKYLKK